MRKINRGAENGLLAMAAKKGASVHYPTHAELKAWRDKAPAAQERIIKELGGRSAEIWKKIQAARKACAS